MLIRHLTSMGIPIIKVRYKVRIITDNLYKIGWSVLLCTNIYVYQWLSPLHARACDNISSCKRKKWIAYPGSYYIRVWTKWLSYCRRLFTCVFLIKIIFRLPLKSVLNWKYISIVSGNGLVPNRRQAITWTHPDQFWWLLKASPGH